MLVRGLRKHDPREWARFRAKNVEAFVTFGHEYHHVRRAADWAAALEHAAKTNASGRRVNQVALRHEHFQIGVVQAHAIRCAGGVNGSR
jgi:hypothetical protein